MALWWHRTASRFNSWRFEFQEKAEEWRERFDHHTQRIRSVIGWHEPPVEEPESEVRDVTIEHSRDGPEQEPER